MEDDEGQGQPRLADEDQQEQDHQQQQQYSNSKGVRYITTIIVVYNGENISTLFNYFFKKILLKT